MLHEFEFAQEAGYSLEEPVVPPNAVAPAPPPVETGHVILRRCRRTTVVTGRSRTTKVRWRKRDVKLRAMTPSSADLPLAITAHRTDTRTLPATSHEMEDWARDGEGVGRNTSIKELTFGNVLPGRVRREDFETFCEGIVGNKSIEKLKIYCCTLFGGEIFNMLRPFFEQNINLRCLTVGFEGGRPTAILLSEALSRFNTLREFECYEGPLVTIDVEIIVQALAGHSGMTNICLSRDQFGSE